MNATEHTRTGVVLTLCLLLLFFCTAAAPKAIAQIHATLATSDAHIVLTAEGSAPRLLRLDGHNQFPWHNRAEASLPAFVERDGTRMALTWQLMPALCKVEPNRIVFVYESQQPHLRLLWQWTARASFGPIEHQITVQNLSDATLWMRVFDSLNLDWKIGAEAQLRQLYVEKGAGEPSNAGTHLVNIAQGYHWTGWSTTYAYDAPGRDREVIPYEAIFLPDGSQPGWYAGIEFSGRTRITLNRTPDGLHSLFGLDPQPGPALTRLAPGGNFESPVVFLGTFAGGPDGAGNQLRPWVRTVLGSTRTWGDPHYPLTVNNSWGAGMEVDESVAKHMIADSASLGLEMFHLDAGWFRGVGDWYPDPKKFPHGLAAVADDAHRHGLRFGLWVDWSQAGLDTAPGALNVHNPAVSDWLIDRVPPNWRPQEFKGQTIDIGVPAARDYAAHEVKRIVESYHLDMLEHDGYLVTQGCMNEDHPHASPDRSSMTTRNIDGGEFIISSNSTDVGYHAVQSYYDIYAQLRRQHPGLLLEICNDGGRMVDFGSAAHGDYFSITDSYDPLSNRRAFYDTSYALPAAMLESYVAKWPTPSIENFLYMLRSGMMGWVTLMQDTTAWTPEQHASARQAFALYKSSLRPLIRDAKLFHISDRPDGIHWDGIEYWNPARKKGVVYAFRGFANNEPQHRFLLAGLNPRHRYQLHFQDGSSPDSMIFGQCLMTSGLLLTLPTPVSSELIFLSETREAKAEWPPKCLR
jgi:alpha-galactosidase